MSTTEAVEKKLFSKVIRSPGRPKRNDGPSREQIMVECAKQQAKLQVWLDEISRASSETRRRRLGGPGLTSLVEASCADTTPQDRARKRMAAEHHAAHERVASSLLRAAIDTLQTVKRSPSLSSLNEARTFLLKTLQAYRNSVVSVSENRKSSWTPKENNSIFKLNPLSIATLSRRNHY